MDIKALAFDTGGTVLDWHGGLVAALAAAGTRRELHADWHAVANDWRRRSMKAIVGQLRPSFHMTSIAGHWARRWRSSDSKRSRRTSATRSGAPGTRWTPGRISRRRWPR